MKKSSFMRQKNSTALVLYGNEPQRDIVEQTAQQVKDLFQVNAVIVLQVSNYYQMPEHAKHALCDTLMDVTICKVPARIGEGMWFFLRKEESL